MGRTQKGNNNAYCQDNEISWYDWDTADRDLIDFTSRLIHFRLNHRIFQRPRWFKGAVEGSEIEDIAWFNPNGTKMTQAEWQEGFAKSMAVFLEGQAIPDQDEFGQRIVDDSFYLILNAHYEKLVFTLPEGKWGKVWEKNFSTHEGKFAEEPETFNAGQGIETESRSLIVLRRRE